MAGTGRRRNTSVAQVRAEFERRDPREAWFDLGAIEGNRPLRLEDIRRRHLLTPPETLAARGGVAFMLAWPARLAREPHVVAEFRAVWFIPRTPSRDDADPWIVFGDLGRSEAGYLTVESLTVAPVRPGGGDASRDVLKRIRPSELLRAARAELAATSSWADMARRIGATISPADAAEATRASAISEEAKVARGRPRLTDAELLEVVDACLAEQDVPSSKQSIYERVRRRLAKSAGFRLDRFPLKSPESVKSRLRQAEKRELISAGVKGTARRSPGPKYREVKARVEREARKESDDTE